MYIFIYIFIHSNFKYMNRYPLRPIKAGITFTDIHCHRCATGGMFTLHPFIPSNLEPELGNGEMPSLAPPEVSFGNLGDIVTMSDI